MSIQVQGSPPNSHEDISDILVVFFSPTIILLLLFIFLRYDSSGQNFSRLYICHEKSPYVPDTTV